MVRHAETLLAEMEALEADLADTRSALGGTIRLAVFQSAALGIVPRALTLLANAHPQLRLEVTQREPESALAAVWAREFDLVIAEEYPHHSAPRIAELDRSPLCQDALRLGTMLPGVTTLADAARVPWVMEPRGAASRHWAEQTCRVAGFEPDVRFETADLQAHIRLIESGHAVALLPDLVWGGREPSIRMIRLPGTPHRTVFSSARLSGRDGIALRATREALEQAVEQLENPLPR